VKLKLLWGKKTAAMRNSNATIPYENFDRSKTAAIFRVFE
jgi:hypothetical protein